MKSLAIMQPTFLPWLGYFALMDSVDEFVILDHVQFDRRSWQQRNRIRTANGPAWLTVPVLSKGLRDQAIADVDVEVANPDFPEKMVRSIEQNYRKSPYYGAIAPDLFEILRCGETKLATINLKIIDFVAEYLGIHTPRRLSSNMHVTGTKADALVDICRTCGAGHYVSPPGSRDYLEESSAFAAAGIPVSYFQYDHPVYRQQYAGFEPYMSVVDLLFNEGEKSLSILREGKNG